MKQRTTVVIIKKLDDIWGTEADFAGMTDDELKELCLEDLTCALEDAEWKFIRPEDDKR